MKMCHLAVAKCFSSSLNAVKKQHSAKKSNSWSFGGFDYRLPSLSSSMCRHLKLWSAPGGPWIVFQRCRRCCHLFKEIYWVGFGTKKSRLRSRKTKLKGADNKTKQIRQRRDNRLLSDKLSRCICFL